MGKRNCPVCNDSRSDFIKRIDMKTPEDYHLPKHYNIVFCKSCGMVYADTDASMEDYDYYYSNCNFYGDDSKDDNTLRYKITEELLQQFCKKDSVILDIGAGNGRFEIALRENGYKNIKGIDPSKESVERLKAVGISSEVGNIYSVALQEEKHKYDGIFLFEVAEHLLFPGEGIANIKELLKKDGFFMISVPDYSKINKESPYAVPNYFNLEHINYFSEVSLDNLMGRYGMRRVSQKRVGEDLIQCYKNIGVPIGLKKDVVTRKAVREYLAVQEKKTEINTHVIAELKETYREIVIWGTGSYVINLAATTDLLECNIQGFVDNNKIKQGREMYGYPIYAPEFLIGKKCMVLICSMLNCQDIQIQMDEMRTENDYIVLQ